MASYHPDLSRAQGRKGARSSSEGHNCVEIATNPLATLRDARRHLDRGDRPGCLSEG
jgi:hypothetical protein